MSSFGIFSAIPPNVVQSAAAARTGPVQATPLQASPVSSAPEDTVKLSAGAQALMMHQAGQSVSSIASSLGTSVSAVDTYLGITVAVAIPLTAAHGAPAAKAAPAATADVPTVSVKG